MKTKFKQEELGIKDENGEMLHEGDIIEMDYTALKQPFKIKGVIRYHHRKAQFVVLEKDTFLSRSVPLAVSDRKINRLGDIYTNPELLT